MGRGGSKPASPPLLDQPWRTLPNTQEMLPFLTSYKPQKEGVSHLRILLHGPVGAGKSSFVNSVDSALRGRVMVRASTNANSGFSHTKKYNMYKIRKDDESFYSFIFNDIVGFEQNLNHGVSVEDVKLALKGHVKDGYKFNPLSPLTEEDPGYNSNPSLDDKVHVLVSVVPADKVSLLSKEVVEKLKQVRDAANNLNIPQLAILTKVDEACPEVEKDITNLHKSKYLKEQMEKYKNLQGIQKNCIFLVQNYEQELNTSDQINGPILTALKQMLTNGEDYLNDL
ncbi:interferon-induced protein 44-like [Cheilinus undulatus]|uniref:interferon-induced protein 44-like n=1 Tax=Cheilinus undulatus TaxID=241271 RepID=UPI001BD4A56A|nr:interferon-induced protein 44-like [Cheilinus undulatus]XP_041633908.1 interferon-induced protein 44-like [Cheilinus undulatus]